MTDVAVAACGAAVAEGDALAALRKNPGTLRGKPLAANALRASDDQTVVAVAAVLRAIDGLPPGLPLDDWAVVAAPCYPGRAAAQALIAGYAKQGIRAASPMVVPHFSTHAVSGTVSLTARMRGPNFGVGGGPGHVGEGLLAGLSLALDGRAPGVWLVLTGWNGPGHGGACRACALALTGAADARRRLGVRWDDAGGDGTLAGLCDALAGGGAWACPVEGGSVVLTREGGGA